MIWCVDDDSTIRDIEVYTLKQLGYDACGFADGQSVLEALKSEIPELIVLDVMMPGIDGIELLEKLRADSLYCKIPVIMATAKGTEMDKISGLNMGADDYMVKPFGVMEMVARINAVLRRSGHNTDSEDLTVGAVSIKEKEHTAFVSGVKIELTNKEFAMLRLFMKNPNIVYTRDSLMREIWGVDYVGETRTVDMHINTLRKKLGSAGSCIKTVIGVGYRLES